MILYLGGNVSTLSVAIIVRVLSASDPPLSLGICATIYVDLKLMLCVGLRAHIRTSDFVFTHLT